MNISKFCLTDNILVLDFADLSNINRTKGTVNVIKRAYLFLAVCQIHNGTLKSLYDKNDRNINVFYFYRLIFIIVVSLQKLFAGLYSAQKQ